MPLNEGTVGETMVPGGSATLEPSITMSAASSELLAAVAAQGPDAVLVVDPSGRIVYANDQATVVFGYEPNAFVGMPVDQLVPDAARAAHGAHRANFGATPSNRPMGVGLALQAQRSDGSLVPVEVALASTTIAATDYVIAAVRDVTQTRRALAAQRDHFARLLAAIDEGTLELSIEGVVRAVNSRFCDMVGRTSIEVLANRALCDVPLHREAETRDVLDRALATDAFQAEIELMDGSGRQFPVLFATKRIGDEGGPTVFATIRDLTEEKRAAQALAVARADLALVDERERIARDLHDRVIQRIFAVGLTLEGVASRLDDPKLVERLGRSVAQLDLTIKEIRHTIFDLQHDGRRTLTARVGDVVDVYGRVLACAPSVRVVGPVDEFVTESVGEELLCVVREALSNVAKHAAARSTVVELEVGSGMPRELRLRVTDDGGGFTKLTGTGHGLTNLRERAERLGGHFTIESAKERGTVVSWTVPI